MYFKYKKHVKIANNADETEIKANPSDESVPIDMIIETFKSKPKSDANITPSSKPRIPRIMKTGPK